MIPNYDLTLNPKYRENLNFENNISLEVRKYVKWYINGKF